MRGAVQQPLSIPRFSRSLGSAPGADVLVIDRQLQLLVLLPGGAFQIGVVIQEPQGVLLFIGIGVDHHRIEVDSFFFIGCIFHGDKVPGRVSLAPVERVVDVLQVLDLGEDIKIEDEDGGTEKKYRQGDRQGGWDPQGQKQYQDADEYQAERDPQAQLQRGQMVLDPGLVFLVVDKLFSYR